MIEHTLYLEGEVILNLGGNEIICKKAKNKCLLKQLNISKTQLN
jgi:hypothetical protein